VLFYVITQRAVVICEMTAVCIDLHVQWR